MTDPTDPTDPTGLQARLTSEVQSVEWDALAAHHERGALFEVSPEVPIVKVGMALAMDLVDDVKAWLDTGALAKVTDDRASSWASQPELRLTFLIVQPYVLVTEAT